MTSLKLPKDRNLFFTRQVTQDSIATLTKELLDIETNDIELKKQYAYHELTYTPKPINLFIDSFGGSVYQGFGVIGVMEKLTTPITTIVTGCAMSCGFLMAMHGNHRLAYKHSTLMFHQISSGVWGKLNDMEADVEEAKRLQKIIFKMTLKKTKISKETLEKNYKRKIDWFMPAEEALKNGVIDGII
jgi:ATP-dependent Clp protease protease subunit